MEITLTIESLTNTIKILKDSAEAEKHFNVLLDFIRDLEYRSEEEGMAEKIEALDEILDLLGHIMITAAKDIDEIQELI